MFETLGFRAGLPIINTVMILRERVRHYSTPAGETL